MVLGCDPCSGSEVFQISFVVCDAPEKSLRQRSSSPPAAEPGRYSFTTSCEQVLQTYVDRVPTTYLPHMEREESINTNPFPKLTGRSGFTVVLAEGMSLTVCDCANPAFGIYVAAKAGCRQPRVTYTG